MQYTWTMIRLRGTSIFIAFAHLRTGELVNF